MTELRPYPFGHLVRRALQELEHEQKLFDLPIAHGFFGDEQLDLSVRMHGQRASSPLGPAAGPHTQMAQNIALSWMAGCRVMELKTVQVNDRLEIARPCIDMQTVGYNIEWSQELRIQESLEEYVKASMLLEILKESQLLPLTSNFGETLFDLSLGYDLKGIRHPTVQAFIDSMGDASAVIDRLRKEIPVELASYRDLDFNVCISNQVTLSTFHGCPPSEIERIAEHLLEEKGLHTIVKLNPTLLGPKRLKEILHGTLGYTEANVPLDAFDEDTHWDEMAAFCERLEQLAQRVELGFGVKFSNTLIVRNHRDFFPKSEERMYLSGAPLHVLATTLVADFREQFGMRFPISFSAGIDRHNFADATAIGLVPVTTCSDLLKTGGYRRGSKYFKSLADRMHAVGALNLGEFSIRAFGLGAQALGQLKGIDPETLQTCQTALDTGTCLRTAVGEVLFEEWVRGAQQLGTQHYASQVTTDPRYALAKNSKLPPKMGRDLKTFDCVACDKCVPVCPNGANFSFRIEPCEIPIVKLQHGPGGWTSHDEGTLAIEQSAQYANFADFCNDCGNCDVFCPENGGPYKIKPRFFGSLEDWKLFEELDGFCEDQSESPPRFHGRIDGAAYSIATSGERISFTGPGFDLTVEGDSPASNPEGKADGEVDLTILSILQLVRAATYQTKEINYLSVR